MENLMKDNQVSLGDFAIDFAQMFTDSQALVLGQSGLPEVAAPRVEFILLTLTIIAIYFFYAIAVRIIYQMWYWLTLPFFWPLWTIFTLLGCSNGRAGFFSLETSEDALFDWKLIWLFNIFVAGPSYCVGWGADTTDTTTTS